MSAVPNELLDTYRMPEAHSFDAGRTWPRSPPRPRSSSASSSPHRLRNAQITERQGELRTRRTTAFIHANLDNLSAFSRINPAGRPATVQDWPKSHYVYRGDEPLERLAELVAAPYVPPEKPDGLAHPPTRRRRLDRLPLLAPSDLSSSSH